MILFLVTDRRRLAGHASFAEARRCLVLQAEHAVAAGLDGIIVRERDLEARDLVDLTRDIVARSRGSTTRVLVSDRVDVALVAGADGVHLRGDSFSAREVRKMTPRPFLIGRSVHGLTEALRVTDVDYLVAGTVWPSESKPEPGQLLGLDGLTAMTKAVRVPVLAIGGVTMDRIPAVASAGSAGIAAIGLFMDASPAACRAISLQTIARASRSRFDTSGSRS